MFLQKMFDKKFRVVNIVFLILFAGLLFTTLFINIFRHYESVVPVNTNGSGYIANDGKTNDQGEYIIFCAVDQNYTVKNLEPGIYRLDLRYIGEDIGDTGILFYYMEGLSYNMGEYAFKNGDNRITTTLVVDDSETNITLNCGLRYFGFGHFNVVEYTISKTNGLLYWLYLILTAVVVSWVSVLLILSNGDYTLNLKSVQKFLFLLSLCFIFIAAFFVALNVVVLIISIVRMIAERKLKDFKFDLFEEGALLLLFVVTFAGGFFAKFDAGVAIGGSFLLLVYLLIFVSFKRGDVIDDIGELAPYLAFAFIWTCAFSLVHYYVVRVPFILNLGSRYFLINSSINTNIASLFENWPTRGADKFALTVPFIAGFLFYRWKALKNPTRIAYAAALVLSLWTLALTHSREGVLFVVVALGVFFLLQLRKKAWMVLVPLVAAVALAVGLSANEKIRTTFTAPLQEINIQRRLFQDRVGLEIFRDNNKLTGIGVMNFPYEFKRFAGDPRYENTDFIHNIYIAMLAEAGALGLAAYLVFFIALTIAFWKNRRSFASKFGLSIAAGVSVASLATSMYIYAVPVGIIMWALLGLSRNPALSEKTPD